MKHQTYTYEKDGVKLSFSFEDNEKANEQKATFVGLMREATSDLQKELE